MSEDSSFFKLFRRRGFSETIEILAQCDNFAAVQSNFFKMLGEKDSYPNTYFRVKRDLLKHSIIAYKLNDQNEKVIYLTEKGVEIYNRIKEIEELL